MDYSYSQSTHSSSTHRHPQHQTSSTSMPDGGGGGALRQMPPSAFVPYSYQTPSSQRSTRSLPYPIAADSPFLSPPPSSTNHQQNQHHSARSTRTVPQNLYRTYDSPFQSPPPSAYNATKAKPPPLVLDPSASSSRRQSSTSSAAPSFCTPHNPRQQQHQPTPPSSSAATDMAQKFLQVATGRLITTSAHPDYYNSSGVHATPAVPGMTETAASLARYAPKAGYLLKLGQNITEFKRRFFVLQTETNLYYYLSPNDLEPRGKISLEGTQVKELETLPDGRLRFIIQRQQQQQQGNDIVLESRSKDMGEEWIQQLREERVSFWKEKVDQLTSQCTSQKFQIADLERQVEDFKHVEKDRDGALEDARQWKAQFERLDEALRLLTQQMRQPPTVSGKNQRVATGVEDTHGEEKKEMDLMDNTTQAGDANVSGSTDETPTKNNQSSKAATDLPSSLLDTAFRAAEGQDTTAVVEEIEEIMSVPGTYFSGLANAWQQQRDSLRLAAEEAATAVEDVQEAHAQVDDMKKRMERAEKHLTKLWEENCTIRKALKQKKREKRVLIREYKLLQQANKELQEEKAAALAVVRPLSSKRLTPNNAGNKENERTGPMEDNTMLGSDEERLIDELEEHVVTSIQLHERLMRVREFPLDSESEAELNTSVDNSEALEEDLPVQTETVKLRVEVEEKTPCQTAQVTPRSASLIDDADSEESSSEEDDLSVNEYQSISPSVVSSVGAEFGSVAEFSHHSTPSIPKSASMDSTPGRPNPVLQLDRDDYDMDEYDRQPTLCSASTQSTASKSVITESGQATARLSCPLADVVEPKGYSLTPAEANMDLSVYHLTFYSQKIGIQFQKAPPAPVKPKGLLTAALTADLNGDADGSDKTAAELRNVAAITSLASGRNAKNEEVCPVALPKDAVLVCGFHGFDESGMNQKPRLGARLVAFDGVSVEIGPWTFDSIRKAIQARGRPLTLSFRNDFLTTEQRAVLTKAVMEVDAKCPPRRPTVQFGMRPPSTTPSITSALSHDSECFVNDDEFAKPAEFPVHENDLSLWAQEKDHCCHGKISSAYSGRLRRLSSSSHSTNHSTNFRSFSDAGSSIASNFAPLVATLVKQTNERRNQEAKFTPQYLMRNESLENTPQHHDFQSNLL